MQFDLIYDHNLLTYQGRTSGDLTSVLNLDGDKIFTITSSAPSEDRLRILVYSGDNTLLAAGSGTIVNLSFQVAAEAQSGQSCSLVLSEVTLSDNDGLALTTTLSGGRMTLPGGTTEPPVIGDISLVAGSGSFGNTGDGGPASEATFNYIYGLGLDAAGNLLIADRSSNMVRKVDADGVINKVAGTGQSSGYNGENIPAAEARLGAPYDVAADSAGNLYTSESGIHRIRKIDASTKNISIVAGTLTSLTPPNFGKGYAGDGGPATDAKLSLPQGLVVDKDGNIYFCDKGNHRVRKVDALTKNITTAAGNGTNAAPSENVPATETSLNSPVGLAVDSAGNLYVVAANRVYKIDTQGIIRTVAGNGTSGFSGDGFAATDAMLSSPLDVEVDAAGNLFIADYSNLRIRMVDTAGIITTIAGDGTMDNTGDGGPAAGSQLNNPTSVALDAQGTTLYVGTQTQVRKIAITPAAQLTAPVLTPDSTDNTVGQDITLSFTEDAAWRGKISEIIVDGTPLDSSKYNTTTPGAITIDKSVFGSAKDYAIVITADGYNDAAVTQTMTAQSGDGHAVYTLTPVTDPAYTNGTTLDGINTMTVNSGISGLSYFTVNISPVQEHSGKEIVVFVHLRDGVQVGLNATKADFDIVAAAASGFNVQAGDVVKAYIVDELNNALNFNPTILQ